VSPSESHDRFDDLNRWCRCVAVDAGRLRVALEARAETAGLYASIQARQPHLFSASAVFVSRAQLEEMGRVVGAVERLVDLPAYRAEVLTWAPEIARVDPGPRGAFLGFDFHVSREGPKLIEINTNAGGALLNTALAAAELACCPEVARALTGPAGAPPACAAASDESPVTADDAAFASVRAVESSFLAMFREEWRLAGRIGPLTRVAIVDAEPETQYLHPEFLLFRELFAAAGIAAEVCDPRELTHADGALHLRGEVVDLVYNRLTDFALAGEAAAALRSAYLAGDAVLTPHPRAHALYADKRNLAVLSDAERLRRLGAPEETIAVLARSVPPTRVVDADRSETWWAERKRWFFKPVAGFGGRAAYRGDKLTRGAFATVLAEPYVAQEIVPPSERTIERDGVEVPLKLDLRNYAYAGRVQLVAARLYQGQTTNFRTPGGGFAPVFSDRD
jgi:hypothetical protein